MSKSHCNGRHKQTIRFLKWINRYSGWWYLICTPNDEHINNSIIGDGSQPLTEFDDALFEAMVEKVIIKSTTEFEFIFESGQKVKAKASK